MLIKKQIMIILCLLLLSLLWGCHASTIKAGYIQNLKSENGMNYHLYIPKTYHEDRTYPLFIMLHGGTQTAKSFALSTDMNTVAENKEVIVIYPEQSTTRNEQRYWNWFLPENQTKDGIELLLIMEIVDLVMSQYRIDFKEVYAIGFSAGAAMALNLAIAYSDVFNGVASAAGVPYGVADNGYEAYMAMSGVLPPVGITVEEANIAVSKNVSEPFKVLVFQGTEDSIVSVENAYFMIEQMIELNDLLDNQIDDNSFHSDHYVEKTLFTENLVEYHKIIYFNDNQEPMIGSYMIEGMDHAWPGGNPGGIFVDASAPNMSEIIYDFFIDNIE